jgi:hypothetical protein
MIVHDFHVSRVATCPHKTEATLIVDANAVLPLSSAFKRFQVVARQRTKVSQVFRFVECREFPLGDPFNEFIFP